MRRKVLHFNAGYGAGVLLTGVHVQLVAFLLNEHGGLKADVLIGKSAGGLVQTFRHLFINDQINWHSGLVLVINLSARDAVAQSAGASACVSYKHQLVCPESNAKVETEEQLQFVIRLLDVG